MQMFLSYSHDDIKAARALVKALGGFKKTYGVEIWWDESNKYRAGERLDAVVGKAIAEARVSLLLASQAIFNSDYIYGIELPAMRAAADANNGRIIGVVLEDCCWPLLLKDRIAVPLGDDNRIKPILDIKPPHARYRQPAKQIEDSCVAGFGLKPLPGPLDPPPGTCI